MRRALTHAVVLGAVSAAPGALAEADSDEPAAVAATRAGAPVVDLDVDRREVALGEPFSVVVSARHAPQVQVSVPQPLALAPAFGERRRAQTSRRNADGTVTREFELELLAFEIGAVELPTIPVRYETTDRGGQVFTDPLPLLVRDPLAGAGAELRDIAPPGPVERPDYTWIYAGLAAIAGGGLAAFVAQRRRRAAQRRRAEAPVAPLPSPGEEALARLEALAASGTLDADHRRPAYFEMSEIVRSYLGRRYGFPALDLTTAEIRKRLEAKLDSETLELVLAWLGDVDAVKYAGYGAGIDEARDALDRAVDLVLETRASGGDSEEATA